MSQTDLLCENRFVRGLQKAGVRLTPQRTAIVTWLADCKHHPTAAEIFQALAPAFPGMSLATVYNTLSLLLSQHLIHDLPAGGDGSLRYELNPQPHINLMCLNCHQIQDVFAFDFEPVHRLAQQHHFTIQDTSITAHGLCAACQATRLKEDK